jgi:hypothetical protein
LAAAPPLSLSTPVAVGVLLSPSPSWLLTDTAGLHYLRFLLGPVFALLAVQIHTVPPVRMRIRPTKIKQDSVLQTPSIVSNRNLETIFF